MIKIMRFSYLNLEGLSMTLANWSEIITDESFNTQMLGMLALVAISLNEGLYLFLVLSNLHDMPASKVNPF